MMPQTTSLKEEETQEVMNDTTITINEYTKTPKFVSRN